MQMNRNTLSITSIPITKVSMGSSVSPEEIPSTIEEAMIYLVFTLAELKITAGTKM